jgi:hypothetical protein
LRRRVNDGAQQFASRKTSILTLHAVRVSASKVDALAFAQIGDEVSSYDDGSSSWL